MLLLVLYILQNAVPSEDFEAGLPPDIRKAVQQQVLPQKGHPQIDGQCQHMQLEAMEFPAEACSLRSK